MACGLDMVNGGTHNHFCALDKVHCAHFHDKDGTNGYSSKACDTCLGAHEYHTIPQCNWIECRCTNY